MRDPGPICIDQACRAAAGNFWQPTITSTTKMFTSAKVLDYISVFSGQLTGAPTRGVERMPCGALISLNFRENAKHTAMTGHRRGSWDGGRSLSLTILYCI